MLKNNLDLQASISNLDLTAQQEVSTSPIQTPFVITATTSLASLAIGVASTLSIIGRWYVKFIPLFRKLFPNSFKSDLDEWLETLVYRLVLRDENVRRENSLDELRTVLEDTSTVVDLIELDPNELNNYLHSKIASADSSLDSILTCEVKGLSEIEEEANLLAIELERLHEVETN